MFSLFSILFLALILLSLLSRFGVVNVIGVAVVYSNSMYPVLKPLDIILYANTGYERGDIVVYCLSPFLCVSHRVVSREIQMGQEIVLTKGDNSDSVDPPVSPSDIRGKVVAVIPREAVVPLLVLSVASVFYMYRRTLVGYVFSILLATMIVFTLVFQNTLVFTTSVVKTPVFELERVVFNTTACSVDVFYRGNVYFSSLYVHVKGEPVESLNYSNGRLIVFVNKTLLSELFEREGVLNISVTGVLNNYFSFRGSYVVNIHGADPVVEKKALSIVITNPNCFPIRIYVSEFLSDGNSSVVETRVVSLNPGDTYVIQSRHEALKSLVEIKWLNRGVEKRTVLSLP